MALGASANAVLWMVLKQGMTLIVIGLGLGIAMALSGILWIFLHTTDMGKAMRAAAQKPEVAMLMGINPDRVFCVAVGVALALAGAAGSLLMPFYPAYPMVGQVFVLMAFVAVVLGTLGNVTFVIRGTGTVNFVTGGNTSTGDLFSNTAFLNVLSGATFDFNGNGETFGAIEGAAASTAALLSGKVRVEPGEAVVAIVSGGNIAAKQAAAILDT